jgi:hypothetical protein
MPPVETITYPHPYKNRGQPVQPVNPRIPKLPRRKAREPATNQPTFDIPLGRSNTSAKSTSPAGAERLAQPGSQKTDTKLTLAHEIFEVMPLDIVGEVADVDTAVLLGVFAYVRHHLVFGSVAVFGASRSAAAAAELRGGSAGIAWLRGSRSTVAATVALAASRSASGRVGAASVSRTTRPSAWRPRPVALLVGRAVSNGFRKSHGCAGEFGVCCLLREGLYAWKRLAGGQQTRL